MANTAIYQNLLQAPKSIADYDAEAVVSQTARQNMLMNGLKLDEYSRARTAESELRSLYAGVPQGATQDQVAQHLLSSRTPQGIAAGQAMLKEIGAAKKVAAETDNQISLADWHKQQGLTAAQGRSLAAKDAHLQTSTSVTTPEQSIAWAERAKDHGWPADEARDLAVMFKGMPDGGLKLLPMLREQAVKIGDRARITGEMDRTVATNVAAGERSAATVAGHITTTGMTNAQSDKNNRRTVGEQARVHDLQNARTKEGNRVPKLTTIIDPADPTKMIVVDANVYNGGVERIGVVGVAGKEPSAALREDKTSRGIESAKSIIDTLRESYASLDKMRSIPSTERGTVSNVLSGIAATSVGQTAGRMAGTTQQVERDVIQSSRLQLLNGIKQATGMSAQQLNSNVELKTWLDAVSNPGQSYQAVDRILTNIEKFIETNGKYSAKNPSRTSQPKSAVDAALEQYGGGKK